MPNVAPQRVGAELKEDEMSEQNGRDASGRFLPGHSVKSPGRPRKAVEERYLCILSQRVSPEVFAKIVDKAAEQALEGDAKAREWLSWYLIGKPSEYVNADLTTNGDALTFEVVWNHAAAGLSEKAP